MTTGNLFAGFGSFENPVVPEGALQVVYGLSVDTVQIVGEATAANPEGLTPADLAAKLASKFNMPVQGLRVFVDGKELDFNAPIPTGARNLEFRQPSGEKGTVLLPLKDEDAVLISICRRDTTEYVSIREEPKGKISKALIDLNLVDIDAMEVLSEGREYVTVGFRHPETLATRTSMRFEDQIRRHVGGEITGASRTVPIIFINDLTAGQAPLEIHLNGEHCINCRELSAGDELIVILPGETTQEDFETWARDQRQSATGAVWAAQMDREAAIKKRTVELLAMNWAELRITGAKAGVKLSGLGRTADAVRADILLREFPEVDEQEVYNTYLREFAPELINLVETIAPSDEGDWDD